MDDKNKFNHHDLVDELMKLGYDKYEATMVALGKPFLFSETNLEIAKKRLLKKGDKNV